MLALAARLRNFVFFMVASFSFSGVAFAGVVVEDKPVSLLGLKVVMERGQPCIALSDLARSLGGTLVVNQKARTVAINPGPSGALKLNTSALSAMAARKQQLGGSPLKTPNLSQGQQEERNSVQLKIGGVTVGVQREEEEERLLLRPSPMMPLSRVAQLLGGKARFDAGRNQWFLPAGNETTALSLSRTARALGESVGPKIPPIGGPVGPGGRNVSQ